MVPSFTTSSLRPRNTFTLLKTTFKSQSMTRNPEEHWTLAYRERSITLLAHEDPISSEVCLFACMSPLRMTASHSHATHLLHALSRLARIISFVYHFSTDSRPLLDRPSYQYGSNKLRNPALPHPWMGHLCHRAHPTRRYHRARKSPLGSRQTLRDVRHIPQSVQPP